MAAPQSWEGSNQVALSTETSENEIYFVCKRCIDLCVASLVLIFLLPLLLLIAVLIKMQTALFPTTSREE